jgi:hypothetical protein
MNISQGICIGLVFNSNLIAITKIIKIMIKRVISVIENPKNDDNLII